MRRALFWLVLACVAGFALDAAVVGSAERAALAPLASLADTFR